MQFLAVYGLSSKLMLRGMPNEKMDEYNHCVSGDSWRCIWATLVAEIEA